MKFRFEMDGLERMPNGTSIDYVTIDERIVVACDEEAAAKLIARGVALALYETEAYNEAEEAVVRLVDVTDPRPDDERRRETEFSGSFWNQCDHDWTVIDAPNTQRCSKCTAQQVLY